MVVGHAALNPEVVDRQPLELAPYIRMIVDRQHHLGQTQDVLLEVASPGVTAPGPVAPTSSSLDAVNH